MRVISLTGFILVALVLLAQPTRAFIPFGGRVGFTFGCLNGILFNLVPPSTPPTSFGTYLWQWGTPLSQFWAPPTPQRCVLGGYLPGGCCFVPAPWGVACIPVKGTVSPYPPLGSTASFCIPG